MTRHSTAPNLEPYLRLVDADQALHEVGIEVSKLGRLRDQKDPRVVRAWVRASLKAVRAGQVIADVAATGDPTDPTDDASYAAALAAKYSKLISSSAGTIDELAPPLPERPLDADWRQWVSSMTAGKRASEAKLRSLTGKLIADGTDVGLIRRFVVLEGEASCEPRVTPQRCETIVSEIVKRELEK